MKENKTGLEDFVGRHRADFDAFEPRPELWDAIEQDLDAPAPEAAPAGAPLRILPLRPRWFASDASPARKPYAYGIAATLILLLLAGIGIWTKNSGQAAWTRTGAATITALLPSTDEQATENPFGLGAEPVATAATEAPAQRVAAAVLRMENYYAIQIRERQTELNELDAQLKAGSGDWKRELTTLDSTYQQLKTELTRNPEPSVVLDAMNRNLQIRLDILNQQLRTRAQVQEYSETPPKP
ncbi:hypothetical protein GCM10022408_26500 [Hymenobacter fastidiosus]|uniref:Anti-sigma factor n=1 Tax=Hymenobacter fastidiosus TaxID=486264 RepID=A0ABP7SJR3_9BACT